MMMMKTPGQTNRYGSPVSSAPWYCEISEPSETSGNGMPKPRKRQRRLDQDAAAHQSGSR